MKTNAKYALLFAMTTGLLLTGCGKPPTGTGQGGSDDPASSPADDRVSQPDAQPGMPTAAESPRPPTHENRTLPDAPSGKLSGEQADPAAAAPVQHTNSTGSNATPGKAEVPGNVQETPFADAGWLVKETYSSALLAYKIGDYAAAATGLETLATNAVLTAQQKLAVEDLLAKARQMLAPAQPSPPVAPAQP